MYLRGKVSQKGFTIIEVMIVLAIAGVIIAAVLVAVPQLQKNQRNSARRAILSRLKTEIDNFVGNNNGNVPTMAQFASGNNCSTATGGTFVTNYLKPVSSFTDPNGNAVTYCRYLAGQALATVSGTQPSQVVYNTPATCNGEDVDGASTATRTYAVKITLEGGASYCLDNQ